MEFGNVHSVPVSLAGAQLYGPTEMQDCLGNVLFSWVALCGTKTIVTVDKGENKYWGHPACSATSIIPCQKEVTARSLAPNLFLVLGVSHSLSSQVGPLPSGLHGESPSLCKEHFICVKHRKPESLASPGGVHVPVCVQSRSVAEGYLFARDGPTYTLY